MTRQEANKEIIKLISKYADAHPDQRFGQILLNMGLVQTRFVISKDCGLERLDGWRDAYNDEPVDLLLNLRKNQVKEILTRLYEAKI